MKKIIVGVLSFLLLDLFFNLSAHFIGNTMIQLLCLFAFFPIAHVVAKANGLNGIKGIGLTFRRTERKFFLVSFFVGLSCWTLMYLLYWRIGKFDITGVKLGVEAFWTLAQVLVGFFLGSLINDLITRGFVLNVLSGKLPPITVGLVSILIYALDDFWNGDFTLMNFVFSLVLGCSLTFAFYQTKAVWADTGLHFGLNVAFGLFYGLSGNYGAGLIETTEGSIDPVINNVIVLSAAALLFVPVFFYYRKSLKRGALDETVKMVGS